MADREKLIELLCEAKSKSADEAWFSNATYAQQLEIEADHLIENGVTVTDNNVGGKWIPVTERLPEIATVHNTRWDKSTDSIRVLCSCVQADGKKMVKEGYCKVYSDGIVCWKIPGTIHSVTHWQYLPEPPKGE